jgi:hypothetical protein
LSEYLANNLNIGISVSEMTLLNIDSSVCAGDEISFMLTRKGKLQNSGTHVPTSILETFNIADMKNHDGMEHYLNYAEILDVFQNERFMSDDPNIVLYKNI